MPGALEGGFWSASLVESEPNRVQESSLALVCLGRLYKPSQIPVACWDSLQF